VNLFRQDPIIVVVTVIDIVFVLAAPTLIETLVVVVVPCSAVIPLPPPVPCLTIEKWMSTGGWRSGLVSAPDPRVTSAPGDQEDLCQG